MIVPTEVVVCGTLDLRKKAIDLRFDSQHEAFPTAMEAFGKLMLKYPLYNWDPTVNDGRPFCRSHFFTSRQFLSLDIYTEVYKPLGIDNHCAIYVPTQPGEIMFFGIERKGGPDFSPDEMALLRLAQKQLSNAHQLARAFDESSLGKVSPHLLNQAGLTPREAETLFWMSEGKTNVEIAVVLGTGIYTVKDHVTSIFNKTGVGNRLAAVLWARRTCQQLEFSAQQVPVVQVPLQLE